MVAGVLAVKFFLRLKSGWLETRLNAVGLSGGTLVSSNPDMAKMQVYNTCARVMLEGFMKGFSYQVRIFNIYGPYCRRVEFWDRVKTFGILSSDHTIIAGDLNFTISEGEVWGCGKSVDPLADYIVNLFEEVNPIDVKPAILSPTWSNRHIGSAGIAKRLDHFYVVDSICQANRSWNQPVGFSDHYAIILQFDFDGAFCYYAFKFNARWLDEPSFCSFFRHFWLNLLTRVS